MIFSGIMLLSIAAGTGEWSRLTFTTRSFAALAYLTIMGSLVAYTAYMYAIKHLPISTVSLYAYINPVIAVVLGALLLAEPLSPRIFLAAGLVLAGMWVVQLRVKH